MRLLVLLLTVVVSLALVGAALAVPPGKTFEFADGKQGKVVFDGKIHADKGNKCPDCHTKIWKMKKADNPKMTMAEMNDGKFCGTCHNGTKAFATKDEKNCGKCHKK